MILSICTSVHLMHLQLPVVDGNCVCTCYAMAQLDSLLDSLLDFCNTGPEDLGQAAQQSCGAALTQGWREQHLLLAVHIQLPAVHQ